MSVDLPAPFGPDEADDARLDVERQPVERDDVAGVALRQGFELDQGHRAGVYPLLDRSRPHTVGRRGSSAGDTRTGAASDGPIAGRRRGQ